MFTESAFRFATSGFRRHRPRRPRHAVGGDRCWCCCRWSRTRSSSSVHWLRGTPELGPQHRRVDCPDRGVDQLQPVRDAPRRPDRRRRRAARCWTTCAPCRGSSCCSSPRSRAAAFAHACNQPAPDQRLARRLRRHPHLLPRAARRRPRATAAACALVVPGERTEIEPVGPYRPASTPRGAPAPAFDRRYRIPLADRAICRRSARAHSAILGASSRDLVEICDKYSLPYLAALLRKRLLAGLARRPVPRRPELRAVRRQHDRVPQRRPRGARASPAGTFATSTARRSTCTSPTPTTPRASCTRRHVRSRALTSSASVRWASTSRGSARCDARLGVAGAPAARAGLGPDWSVLLLLRGSAVAGEECRAAHRDRCDARRAPSRPRRRDYRLVVAGDGPLARSTARRRHAGVPEVASCCAGNRLSTRAVWRRSTPARTCSCIRIRASRSASVRSRRWPRACRWCCPKRAACCRMRPAQRLAGRADPAAFADAVRQATIEPDRERILNARRTACAHDWPRVAALWFSLYDELIRRHDFTANPSPRTADPRARGVLGVRAALCAGAQPACI